MKRTLSHLLLSVLAVCFLQPTILIASAHTSADGGSKITSVAETRSFFWVGSADGLWKIKKKTNHIEYLTTGNSMLPSNQVTAICAESDDNIWIGTAAGILRYDNYAFYVVTSKNSNLPDDHITALACDVNGNTWIGTAKGGLVRKIRYGRFAVYNSRNSKLQNDCIYSVTPDNNENVWIGLVNDGIAVFQNEKWAALDARSDFDGANIDFVSNEKDRFNIYCSNDDVYVIADRKILKQAAGSTNHASLSVKYNAEGRYYWLHNNANEIVVTPGEHGQVPDIIADHFKFIEDLLFSRPVVLNP